MLHCLWVAWHAKQAALVQVQDVPGLVERLLGFLDIGKDFVTAETIVQVRAEVMCSQA